MSKLLYIVDAGDNWALADDLPNVHEWLNEIDELWEQYEAPITINEIDSEECL